MKYWSVMLICLFLFAALNTGCVRSAAPVAETKVEKVVPFDFFLVGEQLARQLKENHRGQLVDERLLMTTFVSLDNLDETTSFGRLITESLATRLFFYKAGVLETRKARQLLVKNRQGELILSREAARIADQHQVTAIVAGTYTATPDQIVLNVRLLDASSDEVLSVAGLALARNHAVNTLLSIRGGAMQDNRLSAYER